jgi:glycosyltransferase involved in cell wall biosynthesis
MIANPKVTVLMPVYDSEQYLREAIESILNQTYKKFEFLIINDGSTDSSRSIILSYKDNRIRLIDNEKNIGLTKSLNKGIKLANGEYIARMDADDISLPERLQKQLDYMEQNTRVGVCGSWYKIFDNKDRIVKTLQKSENIRISLFFKNSLGHSTVMIRKEHLLVNGLYYDESMEMAQDYFLWVRLSEYTKCYNLPEVLQLYRVYPEQISISSRKSQDNYADQVRLYQLQKIGIKPNQSEWQIHKMICENNYKNINLNSLEDWIKKVILANKDSLYFKYEDFSKILCLKYWHICKIYEINGARKFRESELNKIYNYSLKIRVKAIIYSKIPVKYLKNRFKKVNVFHII